MKNDEPAFLNDLQKNLVEYKAILQEEDRIAKAKERYRKKFKKWLTLNELKSYNPIDEEGQEWKLSLGEFNKRSVNWDNLKEYLSENQIEEVVKNTESEMFTCRPIKNNK